MKRSYTYLTFLISSSLLFSTKILAEEQSSLFSMNIEQVLDIPVTIASKGAAQQTVRNAPGSVIVIDSEMILNSGARDLWELLRYVPGFQLAGDVLGTTQLGFRGLTNVGRISLRIDGQEMSELGYQTIPNIGHYPVSDIEKIEIIRGPGAILYGGTAEYAVIEISTKSAKFKSHGEFVASTGVTREGSSGNLGTVRQIIGDEVNNISIAATGQRGVKGSGTYEDLFGNSFRMKDEQEQTVSLLNVGGKTQDFAFRYITDHSYDMERDQYFVASSENVEDRFNQERAEISYSPKLTDRLNAKIFGNYLYDEPYKQNTDTARRIETSDPASFGGLWFDRHVRRYSGSTEFTYTPTGKYSVLLGGTAYQEKGGGPLVSGERSPEYDAIGKAVYGQLSYSPSIATFTAGSRYEYSDNFDPALVSRLAITKATPNWHTKLQLAQSFRAPGYANTIAAFPKPGEPDFRVNPEKSLVSEAEFGQKLSERMYLTGTIFHIKTDDPITLFNDVETATGGYLNFSSVGSYGGEASLRYLYNDLELNFLYSYYRAQDPNFTNGLLRPDGTIFDSSQFIGYSPHVLSLLGTWKLSEKTILHSDWQFLSTKYENETVDESGSLVLGEAPTELLARLALTLKAVGWSNVTIQTGVNNLFDEEIKYAPDGPNYHGTLPGLGREFFVTARVEW